MIGRIRGILIEKKPPQLIVEAGGVGYEIFVPMTTAYGLPRLGEEVILLTHLVVREDAQILYGFSEGQALQCFRTLIKINGIGPKLALTILSGMEVGGLIRCILAHDTGTLVKLPGVGKKTAERLCIELRDKVSDWVVGESKVSVQHAEAGINDTSAVQDAVSGLVALGYKPHEASQIIRKRAREGMTSGDLIRLALQEVVVS